MRIGWHQFQQTCESAGTNSSSTNSSTNSRILDLYLNVVEFAPGVYGAEAAAQRYFGKPAAALARSEAAALAGGLPQPSSWHPGSTSKAYLRRVERIAGRIERAAWLRGEI